MPVRGDEANRTAREQTIACLVLHRRFYRALQGAYRLRECRPFTGVWKARLAHFAESGARMGVLTNKPQELAMPLLEPRPGAVLQNHSRRGPLLLREARRTRISSRGCDLGGAGAGAIMIGDSATDVATARAAGVPVVLLSYGYTPEPAETLGANEVADAFLQAARDRRAASWRRYSRNGKLRRMAGKRGCDTWLRADEMYKHNRPAGGRRR